MAGRSVMSRIGRDPNRAVGRTMETEKPTAQSARAGNARDLERVERLVRSVNETSRILRAAVAAMLLVGLYLGLTLLTASDENLLRNAVVALPQMRVGLTLEDIYTYVPAVFVYLHIQALYILSVLRAKVERFGTVVDEELEAKSGTRAMREYWDWLTASSFVQQWRPKGAAPWIASPLSWLTVVGIPLATVVLIILSFLRYQSPWLSTVHHALLLLDLAVLFLARKTCAPAGVRFVALVLDSRGLTQGQRTRAVSSVIRIVPRLSAVVLLVAFVLQSQPLHQNLQPLHDFSARVLAWVPGIERHPVHGRVNLYDQLLCDNLGWPGFCRVLKLTGTLLVRDASADREQAGVSATGGRSDPANDRNRFGLDLRSRSLREAQLDHAVLFGADLAGADLTGATLRHADLRSANLEHAFLRNTVLTEADLRQALLNGLDLRTADLREAILSGTELARVRLDGSDLSGANLAGANLNEAELAAADLVRSNVGPGSAGRSHIDRCPPQVTPLWPELT